MPRYAYEWLSGQDHTFLLAESENAPMHVAAVGIFEAGPMRSEDGGVCVDRFLASMQSILHLIPRYRQRLEYSPLEHRPIWVDDRHFQLRYHVHHAALPKPGSLAQLKELAGWILSRQLDRARPLWEAWLIEGLEGGEQFALITKIHHCMVDGAAGADIAQIMLSPSPRTTLEEPASYTPRPLPSRFELARDEILRGASRIARAAGAIARAPRESGALIDHARKRAASLSKLARYALKPASPTPLNGEVGPHRQFDWLTMPLEAVLEVRKVLGTSVNDVVLATVAGAVRKYLLLRRAEPSILDFRISAPVNMRRASERGQLGNHVSSWVLPLPIAEKDPLTRLHKIREETAQLKRSDAAAGVETLLSLADWLPPRVLASAVGLAAGPANMIVTNVRGPELPLYMVGAKLLGMYPVVPLLPRTGLGVALFSYDGRLCWGFAADQDLVPDLPAFVRAIRDSFEELRTAAVGRMFRKPVTPAAQPPSSVSATEIESAPPAERPLASAPPPRATAELTPLRPRRSKPRAETIASH
ncbi:MAG TPA: wax ester/triacylglycerol synthase family O-acyltransferase [Myxococcota bacterium]|nr:wax ester/triacylglycerol synthase family O-acyltransferase [Myxococcota bacterium]